MSHQLTSPPTPPSPVHATTTTTTTTNPVHKTLASAANLANLLPTGTVLAFQTFTPSFSNKGICQLSNKCLTSSLIAFCAIICIFSSFTDSFTNRDGKLYYGIATFKGLFVFNSDNDQEIISASEEEKKKYLAKFKLTFIDFVHAFVSLSVFLVYAFSDSDVQNCFFPMGGSNLDVLVMNLPLAAGVFSSFVFMLFPTTRRGIGYADMPAKSKSSS